MVLNIMKGLCIVGMIMTAFLLVRSIKRIRSTEEGEKRWQKEKKNVIYNSVVGFVANFFDTLGIGSYATSTAAFKIKGSVNDINIPGTLNVGDTFPVLAEAFLFFSAVKIDIVTLVSLLVAMVVGARVGAGIVTKMDVKKIRLGMGVGLFIVGVVMALKELQIGPFGVTGTATGIYGVKLVVSIIIEFFLGALMNIGIGAYAPTFALVSLMGMSVRSAFPIMMGGCAFLMTFGAGPEFLKTGRYDMVASVTNAIFGIVGVAVAYLLVKSMPLTVLLWVVVAVVFYTSIMFINDYRKMRKEETSAAAASAETR